MEFSQHLAAITSRTQVLVAHAASAGADAEVPTAPGWRVRDLVAHLGMVHRWATAVVVGDASGAADPEDFAAQGLSQSDPLGWLTEGAAALVGALGAAPADLEAMTFLKDAPPAREFWARRQCHETTIHSVDAISAKEDRMPSAQLCGVDTAVAVDGLDELLTGFLPRSRSRLRKDHKVSVAVRPSDSDDAWLVRVSEDTPATTRHTAGVADLDAADVTFSGTAAELYLGLWNRGHEITTNDPGMLRRWHELARVEW